MLRKLNILAGIIFWTLTIKAQDTLPKFSVVDKGQSRTLISWTNPYKDTIRQLSIQRSYDSLKSFKTILTVPDPTVPQNGYLDAQAPAPKMFYRLYIMLEGGRFLFSKSSRPTPDTAKDGTAIDKNIFPANGQFKTIDSLRRLQGQISPGKNLPSIETFKPSRYVFTEKDGNIKLNLPEASNKKYNVKFFEEDGTALFEIKQIKDTALTLDKTNFIHSGWFKFELYEEGTLKEKHKFFVPKDF